MTDTDKSSPMEISLSRAYHFAGVNPDDNGFVTDSKLLSWIGRRSFRCVISDADDYQEIKQKAIEDGVELLIIKEKNHVSKP